MPKPKGAGKAAKAQEAAQADEGPAPETVEASQQDGAAPAKKKRNNNPGIRVQGGRVYDSENGTTCHQCRQKTVETKAKCTRCTLYFCPKCLENRYQEKVEEANAAGDWGCPRCRALCNCSNCRKKAGKEATGQLANIAKKAGFNSVKDLLDKNPHAKALQLPKLPSEGGAGRSGSRGPRSDGATAAAREGEDGEGRKRPAQKRKAQAAEEAERELIADDALPPRAEEMPDVAPLAAHKTVAGAPVSSKRPRGGLAWAADLPDAVALPGGQAGGELASVLEFLQVFGPKLGLRGPPPLAALVAELLQPPMAGPGPLLCPSADDSLVAAVHCRLLEVVRAYWNVKGSVAPGAWQPIMRGYYAAAMLPLRRALGLRWEHGPPAVSGEIFRRPPQALEAGPEGSDEAAGEAGAAEGGVLGVGGAAPAAAEDDYPAGGYWALPAAARVGMLHALVNDALETDELRKLIEGSMGDAMDEEKERKQQLAGMRKEASVAIKRERDQQIALMIAGAATGGLTLEQQQALLEEARQRAEAAAATAAAAKVKALTEKVHPPTVRAAVLGGDRDGRRYLQLQAAPLLTGSGGIVVQTAGAEGPATAADADAGSGGSCGCESYGGYGADSLVAVAMALHPRGLREGPLRAALVHAFKLKGVAAVGGSQEEAAMQAGGGEEATVEAAMEGEEEQEVSAPFEAAAAPVPAPAAAAKKGAATKRGHGGAKQQASTSPPAEAAEPKAPAAAKKAGGRGRGSAKSNSPAAEETPPAAAAGGSKRRRTSAASADGAGAPSGRPKRQKAAAAPAAAVEPAGAKRGARRASPRSGAAPNAAAGKGGEASQLPLKVDDMLPA